MKSAIHKTTCSYCGVGCGMLVEQDSSGKISLSGDPDHPVNRGMLCSKGMNLHYVVQDTSDRILYPEMRGNKHHPRQRVSWDTALERTAAVFRSMIETYGPDSVGFYVSGQCLTEEYYLANKLCKGFIGTNNIDTNSRLCMSSAVAAYAKALGEDSVPISYEDIELSDCILITGANPAWCHPILFRRLEKHKKENPETRIIVADPRRTESCSIADIHLQIKPGTDVILNNAIGRILIEKGYTNLSFIQNHTDGFNAYRAKVMQISLEQAAEICDIPKSYILQTAHFIGQAKGFISMWAMGLNQSEIGLDKNLSLLNLSLITGQIGKPGCGPFSLTGQPNAMGGREVGGMATLLAAHRDQSNPLHRKEVADFWGVSSLPPKPGLTATQMFDALREDRLKAIWIICTNPIVSLPDARMAEMALEKGRFVVVQDISHRSETALYADVLLPAAGWLEKEGSMTNSDRRITYLPKVIDPPGEALPDAEILCRFAKKMGYSGFDYPDMAAVYAEHCQLTQNTRIDISGLSYQRLQNEGTFQWPVPERNHKGTPRLFSNHEFYTPNGRAQIVPTGGLHIPTERPNADFPLILTTGRIRDQWHTMTRTGKVSKLNSHIPRPLLEIHPKDATIRHISDGDIVRIQNPRGEVRALAKITDRIKEGVVFLPMHWGKVLGKDFSRANNLTANRVDPVSKEPDFKYSTVEVNLYPKQKQKIVIVGAGAAAYQFIKTYRAKNDIDEIHVFSSESQLFYNRILLPEYVNQKLEWKALQKTGEEEIKSWKLHLYPGVKIEKISPEDKTVWDQEGLTHQYDVLVLATGSRAFIPKGYPAHLSRVFTLRNKSDADLLKTQLSENSSTRVVIAGGGILGLELAGALGEVGMEVSIVQRASRLMERQLDSIASKILLDVVKRRNIRVFFDNEIETVFQTKGDENLQVNLKSGKSIACDAVVYAIGTRPNIELAKFAGIQCGRGIVVNSCLQTSYQDIFAIGEIAEFEKKCYGITSAAEEQAKIAANFLLGDMFSFYRGSLLMGLLKFPDMYLCVLGQVHYPKNDPSLEEVLIMDQQRGYYKKCVIQNDKLIGAVMIGGREEFEEFRELIIHQTELGEKRDQLLRSNAPKKRIIGRLICSCNQVGEGNIQEKIREGFIETEELCQATGAGLGCGSCKPEIQSILKSSIISV